MVSDISQGLAASFFIRNLYMSRDTQITEADFKGKHRLEIYRFKLSDGK